MSFLFNLTFVLEANTLKMYSVFGFRTSSMFVRKALLLATPIEFILKKSTMLHENQSTHLKIFPSCQTVSEKYEKGSILKVEDLPRNL